MPLSTQVPFCGDQEGLAFIPASELRLQWKRNCSLPRRTALTLGPVVNVARRRDCPFFLSLAEASSSLARSTTQITIPIQQHAI